MENSHKSHILYTNIAPANIKESEFSGTNNSQQIKTIAECGRTQKKFHDDDDEFYWWYG